MVIRKTEINSMMKKYKSESKYMNFLLFLLSIYIFLGYLFSNYISYSILAAVAIGIFIHIIINEKKTTYNSSVMVILIIAFILINILLAPYSIFPYSSIKTSINRSMILAIGLLLCIQGEPYKNGLRYVLFLSLMHSFLTLFSYFFPDVFTNNILNFLPYDIGIESINFLSKHLYAGITNQIGRNSVYISIGIAIIYSGFFSMNNNTLIKKVLFIILCITLLLTGKRGSLLASIIAALFISMIDAKAKGKSIMLKIIRNSAILIMTAVILIYLVPDAAAPINRFIDRIGGDITSGRIKIYKNALELFKEKPFLGWGSGVYSSIYGIGIHSMYIQLLAEHGVVGFVNFIVIMIVNLIIILRALKASYNSKRFDYIEYLLISLYIQIFFIIYGFTENSLNDGFVLIIYMIASSIPHTLENKDNIKSCEL